MKFEGFSALVVDDDADMLGVTKLALESLGIKGVVEAADGLIAKRMIEAASKPFDIVICDWVMPGLDGAGLLAFFREKNPDVPFIMLTGTTSQEKFDEVSSSDKDFFMTKRQSLNDIMNQIESALKQSG
jgi:CheY-like chemotaxis protein